MTAQAQAQAGGFLPSPEQEQLVDATARVVAGEFPPSRLISRTEAVVPNRDIEKWPLVSALEWPALMLPRDAGGPGCSLMDLCLVHRELAQGLVTPVLFASMLAARVAWQAGDRPLAQSLAAGKARAAFAVAGARPGIPRGTGQGTQQVEAHYLIHPEGCTHAVAWNDDGASLFRMEQFSAITACEAIEDSLTLHSASLQGQAPQLRLQDPGMAMDCSLLVAAQLAGAARASLGLALDHAKVREQFGRPIGAFQAIKHKAADMLARVEVAWGQTVMAALEPADSAARVFHTSAAKVLAAEAALKNAAACIQIHGGMGFTAEVAAHLYLKRAHTLDLLGGLNRHHHLRILDSPAPV